MPNECTVAPTSPGHWTDLASIGEDQEIGKAIHGLAARIYPICRSITGDGVRETLGILSEKIPYQVSEVPSGTAVFDWTVPQEWNIAEAYICDPSGKRIIDMQNSNLHVVSYSTPVRTSPTAARAQKAHLYAAGRTRPHTIPDLLL